MSLTQQIKVDCVIKVISVTVSSMILLAEHVSWRSRFIRHSVSAGSRKKTYNEDVIICSPGVKHV
jgi:hypothetical protein